MTPQSYPIAEKALAHGKALEFSVKNQGFYTHPGRPSMHVISLLSLAFDSAQKSAQCGSNQLGQPQARQPFKSLNDVLIAFCKSDGSGSSFRTHESSLSPVLHFPVAGVWRTAIASQPLLKTLTVSDAFVSESVVSDPPALDAKALPLSWILDPTKKRPDRKVELQADKLENIYDRIAARLIQAEAHECDIWLQQDYRQSFLWVSLASKGNKEPFLMSSAEIYGTHPDFVWFKIIANRASRLGKEYSSWYDASGMMKPDLPKKPSTYSNPEAEKFCKDRLPLPSPDKETA